MNGYLETIERIYRIAVHGSWKSDRLIRRECVKALGDKRAYQIAVEERVRK